MLNVFGVPNYTFSGSDGYCPDGYFSVTFLDMTLSSYSLNAVLHGGLSQSTILLTSQHCYFDLMHEVEGSLTENSCHRVFPHNPLQMGFYLDTIGDGNF